MAVTEKYWLDRSCQKKVMRCIFHLNWKMSDWKGLSTTVE